MIQRWYFIVDTANTTIGAKENLAAVKRLPVHRYSDAIFYICLSFSTIWFNMGLETEYRVT